MPALRSRVVWTSVLAYVLLALCYDALVPIGEAPDETGHFEYLRLVMDERRLPAARDGLWQGHQAPLYYLAGAALGEAIRAVTGCRASLPARVTPGFPAGPNYNYLVHGPEERVTAWGCAQWSFHLLRMLSIALTVPTILLTFGILREALPSDPAGAAIGGMMTALLPSHVALSAMLNNDALVNALIAGTTYLVLVACRTGDAVHLARAAALAGVAATAKLSGFYLFGLILVAVALRRDLLAGLARPGRARAWLAAAVACGLLPLAVMARNLREWGDLFAVAALEANLVKLTEAGANPPGRTLARYYLDEMPRLFADGFVIAYGAINFRDIGVPEVAGWGPRLVLLGLALSVLRRGVWRRVDRRAVAILVAGFALFFATYALPGYRYRWLQARYFFNQLPLISLLGAVGIATLRDGVRRLGLPMPDGIVIGLVGAALVALNLLTLLGGVIPHLYRHIGAAG